MAKKQTSIDDFKDRFSSPFVGVKTTSRSKKTAKSGKSSKRK